MLTRFTFVVKTQASEFKENKSLFIQKARQATLKYAMDDKKTLNSEVFGIIFNGFQFFC